MEEKIDLDLHCSKSLPDKEHKGLSKEEDDEKVHSIQVSDKNCERNGTFLTKVSTGDNEVMQENTLVVPDSQENVGSEAASVTKNLKKKDENDDLEWDDLPTAFTNDDNGLKGDIGQGLRCLQKQTEEDNRRLHEVKDSDYVKHTVEDNQEQCEDNVHFAKSLCNFPKENDEFEGWKRNNHELSKDNETKTNSVQGHLEKDRRDPKLNSSTFFIEDKIPESYPVRNISNGDSQTLKENDFDAFSLRKLFEEEEEGEEDKILTEENKEVSVNKFSQEDDHKINNVAVFNALGNHEEFKVRRDATRIFSDKKYNFCQTKMNPVKSDFEQTRMKKNVCKICNKWCLYWNVCRDCNIFLCDYCMKRNHSPVLQHAVSRYMAFSDFGCLDHLQICKYFCLDCTRPRCEECRENKCRHHYLTKDVSKREDKYIDELQMKQREKRTPFTRPFKNMAIRWPKPSLDSSMHQCKYCFTTHERYNLCEDCLDFFCDSCLVMYHPPGHTICKRIPFSVFACMEHKAIYRYFCKQCKELRCEDCILINDGCSDHADMLEKSLKHMAHEKAKFEETIDGFSTKSSRTICTLYSELDQIENEFLLRAILSRDILRQEMTSIRNLIAEKESQLFEDFEKEYRSCVDRIQDYKTRYGNLLEENGQLMSNSLKRLRKNNLHAFYFSAQKMWNRLDKHKNALDSIRCPDDVLQSPILFPFSLCEEKKELEKSLQIQHWGCPSLVCNNHTVYYKNFIKPLRVDDLVSVSSSALTTFSLSVEIRSSVKDTLWKSDDCTCQQYIANVFSKVYLKPKKRYLIKFSLQTKEDRSRLVLRTDNCCNVLLITGVDEITEVLRKLRHSFIKKTLIGRPSHILDKFTETLPAIPRPEFPQTNFTLFGWPLKVKDVKKARKTLGTSVCSGLSVGKNNYRCNDILKHCKNKSFEELRVEDYLIQGLGWNGQATGKFRQRRQIEEKFCCISAMTDYEMYSFEELRLQDYISSGIVEFCGYT